MSKIDTAYGWHCFRLYTTNSSDEQSQTYRTRPMDTQDRQSGHRLDTQDRQSGHRLDTQDRQSGHRLDTQDGQYGHRLDPAGHRPGEDVQHYQPQTLPGPALMQKPFHGAPAVRDYGAQERFLWEIQQSPSRLLISDALLNVKPVKLPSSAFHRLKVLPVRLYSRQTGVPMQLPAPTCGTIFSSTSDLYSHSRSSDSVSSFLVPIWTS